MTMPRLPLLEVFGFPTSDASPEATRHRQHALCPFNNGVPNCTKDKADNPLGVCSIHSGSGTAIICPVRFREAWTIAGDAASFFFPPDARWTSLVEIHLQDADGEAAGNIDLVLVSYDRAGRILDFGACEVQAVYISGNVRKPFEFYMEDPLRRATQDWPGTLYPRADYLSSSRKRLAPQLLFKGGILHAWGKKQAVVLHQAFYDTLPPFESVPPTEADLAWLVYDLVPDPATGRFHLTKTQTAYTVFEPTMLKVTTTTPGPVGDFLDHLQAKLDEALERTPPDPPGVIEMPVRGRE
jgi:hypothetical protein